MDRVSFGQRLHNKVCLITGASNGVGQAVALLFYQHGAKIALLDITPFDKTIALIIKLTNTKNRNISQNILCIKCDISKEYQIESSIKKICDKYGRIDVIVNNAAYFTFHSVLTATKTDWYKSIDVNVIGAANIIKHAVNNGLMKKGSSIINISSMSAFIAENNSATYGVTKAALVQLTRNTALDLYKSHGIRVNTICPGLVDTPPTKIRYNKLILDLKKKNERIPTF
eukprot:376866_1